MLIYGCLVFFLVIRSGKSTLLNVLANRADSNNDTRGEVLFNGQPYSDSVSMSYVMQADYLIPTLTVRETLQYAARLRLPDSLSLDAKLARVEEVIAELGLKVCIKVMKCIRLRPACHTRLSLHVAVSSGMCGHSHWLRRARQRTRCLWRRTQKNLHCGAAAF
jgi:ABC-type taurine transport system ATPase subunit